MPTPTLLPLQFRRQYDSPIDADAVFTTTAERVAYLDSSRRFAGQIVGDAEMGVAFILNPAKDAWGVLGATGPAGPDGVAGAPGAVGPAGRAADFLITQVFS